MLPDQVSEELSESFGLALQGDVAAFLRVAMRGSGPDARPNLRLARAIGEHAARRFSDKGGGPVLPLILKLSRPTGNDLPEPFIAITAAFALVAMARGDHKRVVAREIDRGLFEVTGEERDLVTKQVVQAWVPFAARGEDAAGKTLTWARAWLDEEDREVAYLNCATMLRVLADETITRLLDPDEFFAFLDRTIETVRRSPRSHERAPGRRRILMFLPDAICAAAELRGGPGWLLAHLEELGGDRTFRPLFEDTITKLRRKKLAQPDLAKIADKWVETDRVKHSSRMHLKDGARNRGRKAKRRRGK